MVDNPKPLDAETPEGEYRVERPKSRRLNPRQKLGMAALLAGASVAALWVVWPASQGIPEIEASGVTEFQSEEGGSAFGQIDQPGNAGSQDGADFASIGDELAAQRETLEARNSELQSEVGRLQKELLDLADRAEADWTCTGSVPVTCSC